VSFKKINAMVKAVSFGKMVGSTKVAGCTASRVVLVTTATIMALSVRERG